jgi:hypothetical protein
LRDPDPHTLFFGDPNERRTENEKKQLLASDVAGGGSREGPFETGLSRSGRGIAT